MKDQPTQATWRTYLANELPVVTSLLAPLGYELEEDQPHLKGERFLMQAMTTTGGKKMILLGKNGEKRVVVKATNDKAGKEELRHERLCRRSLHEIKFAYEAFHSPTELHFIEREGYTISIHEFVDQPSSFLERPIAEQFEFSLSAFKNQERARATTKKHFRSISNLFGNRTSSDYLHLFSTFQTFLKNERAPSEIMENIQVAQMKLISQRDRIEQYCGFLTHTDFVPHNFRIKDGILYLLDFSSLTFGNKHESWARFLNFMTLHNPELERLLVQYMEDNRSFEERESLQLLRLFRLGEIISYYTKTLKSSSEQLLELNQQRVFFWNDVLSAELNNHRVDREIVEAYKQNRDSLRSQEEKERQVGLH